MFRVLIISFIVTLLSACSSLPNNLISNNENIVTDFDQWVASDLKVANDVRLGGIIAKVTNLENRTRVEIVNMPISQSGKPDLNSEPQGRYVVYIDGYVESMSFAQGRLVTFLGTSDGTEKGKVGEYKVIFPVLKAQSFYLWRITETVIVDEFDSHLSPCWGFHCRGSRSFPSKGKVIQEVK